MFIYYSGHGGRQLVNEADGQQRCAEMLITYDGRGLLDSELETRLKALSGKTQKTIVFLDACHSGGVTTRSVAKGGPMYAAKAYVPDEGSCTKPTNVLTRGLAQTRAAGSGGGNFVHIAAARDSEISLDQPGKGGVATQAWQACLAGAAADLDGSGGLSAEEVRACAQARIDQQLSGGNGYLPHHVSLTGNSGMVLSYATRDADAAPAPAPAPAPGAAPSPAPLKPAPAAQPTASATVTPPPARPVAAVPP
ncbi:MAG: caspase family protein [Rhodocyclales bacterium]|nr:caspase family protein [Rhodocyclales bacterium]